MRSFSEFLICERLFAESSVICWLDLDILNESAENTRYSVEVNFRTTAEEALDAFAKIVLGYVSAGIKQHNFHVKHVFSDKPLRVLVSARNWSDDGGHTVCVSWNPAQKCFICSSGFFNKDRNTISIQQSRRCDGDNAAEITKHVYNLLHDLKGKPDRVQEKLKPVPLKRGPKG